MQKPNNYEETQAQGEWTPVELGGHKMVIKQVSEKQSQNGKPMIVVLFDFAPDDKQPNYFMDSFQNDSRPDKKWSNQGTQYILTEDQDGKCSRSFKTFCTCVENSNTGFTCWKNDQFDFVGIKGKKMKFKTRSLSQIVESQIREHSRKPDEVRNKIVELCGDIPRIELFARQTCEGWDCWGNEV